MTPEEWERIQEIVNCRLPIVKGNACFFYNLFHSIVYYTTCGKSTQIRYEKVGRTDKNCFISEMRKPIDKTYYISQTYIQLEKNLHQSQDRSRGFVQSCPEVHSRTGSDGAQRYCHIYQPLSIRIERQYMADASEMQKECKRLEARNLEIYDMILSIYTDEVKCVLSEQ